MLSPSLGSSSPKKVVMLSPSHVAINGQSIFLGVEPRLGVVMRFWSCNFFSLFSWRIASDETVYLPTV